MKIGANVVCQTLRVTPTAPRPVSVLRQPDFLKLWTGQSISMLGSSISDLAIPLLAVLTLHATASQMGVLQAVERAPYLFFALVVGAWVDRVRRRQLLIWTDLVRGVLTLAIPLAAFAHLLSIPLLWAVGLVIAMANMVFELAYRAYLPVVAGRAAIVEANSRFQVSASTVSIVGPSAAGLLVQTLTAPIAILVDAVTFFVSSGSLLLVRKAEPRAEATGRRRIANEVREGIEFLLRHPILRLFVITTGLFNLFAMFSSTLRILYVVRDLHLTPTQIGFVLGVGAPGALVGAALASRTHQRFGVGPTLVISGVLLRLGLIATPAALGPRALVIAILIAGGFCFGMGMNLSNIAQQSYRQVITPDRLQGRVQAANLMVVFGIAPVGALLAGVLGETIGLRPTLWLGVIGTVFAFLVLLASPVVHVRHPEPT